ncbi:uncharacterized protein mv isoform X2 [Lepeophtheirus salmonis]|uniref:uncharacterized protein mv isoform X2 n=1 Tax=Lepeophtheirus salmonis TaxID=72036 RepID=UPI001AEA3546|nr:lysosomal-trafficking regulator-like isoform X2 [Lepeophtheirus salmonis]
MIHLKVKVPLSIQKKSHQVRLKNRLRYTSKPPSKDVSKTHNSKYINILSKAYDDDSESTLQESFLLHSSKISYIPQNPLDFDYFDMVLRSSDESIRINEWRRSIHNGYAPVARIPLRSPVTDELHESYDLFIVVLNVLTKLIDRETRVRNIKTSYFVALLVASFACEKVSVLLDENERITTTDLLLPLLKLLLTSLVELCFTSRDNSQVIILTSLNAVSRIFHSNGPPPASLLQMQTCVLRIVSSLSFGGGSKLTLQALFDKRQGDCIQIFVKNEDFHQTLKLITSQSNELPKEDIEDYFYELKKVFISYKGTCSNSGETVNLHSAFRSLMIFSSELIRLYGLNSILPILKLDTGCILCVHPSFAWECLLQRSPVPLREDIYKVVERIVIHYSLTHYNKDSRKKRDKPTSATSTPSSPVSSSYNASKFSDSDSAFCTSENSFDSKEQSLYGEHSSTLSTYLLLMEKFFQDEDNLMDLMDHIMRLFNSVHPQMNKKIFLDVILPAFRIYKNHKILSSFCLFVLSSCITWETRFKSDKNVGYYELALQNDIPNLLSGISDRAFSVYSSFVRVELCKVAFDITQDYFCDCIPEDILIRHTKYNRVVKLTAENKTVQKLYDLIVNTECVNEELVILWEETFRLLVNFPHFKSFCFWKGLDKVVKDSLEPNITNVTVVSVLLKVLIQLGTAKPVLAHRRDGSSYNFHSLNKCLENVAEYYVENAPNPEVLKPITKEMFLVNFIPKRRPSQLTAPIFEKDDFFDNNTHLIECPHEETHYDASDEDSTEEKSDKKEANPLFLLNKTINKNKIVIQTSFNFIAACAEKFPSVAQYGISFWIRACKVDYETCKYINKLKIPSFLIEEFKALIIDGKAKYVTLIESLAYFLDITTVNFCLERKDLINLIDIFKSESVPSAMPFLELLKTISLRVTNPLTPKYSIVFSSIKNYRFRTRIPSYYVIDFSFILWVKCTNKNGTVFTFDSESGFFIGIDINPEQKNIFVYLSRNLVEVFTITFYSKGLAVNGWNHITISMRPSKGELSVIVNGTLSFANKSAKYPISKGKGFSQVMTLFPSVFEYSDIRICKGFLKEEDSLALFMRGHQHRSRNSEFIIKQFPDLLKIHPLMSQVSQEEILIVHFDPQNPKHLLVYDEERDNIPSSLLPPSVVTSLCSDEVIDNHGTRLWNVVGQCGGIGTLLLLEARILELKLPDVYFALGLEITLNVALNSFEGKEDFDLMDGFVLLSSLLASQKPGLFTLSVLVNKSLNEDIILFDPHKLTIDWREVDKGPILIYPELLELVFVFSNLVSHQLDGEKYSKLQSGMDSKSLFDVFIKLIGRLVEFSNDFHAHNHKQLREISFDSKLMHYLKESCIEDEQFQLNMSIVEEIGDIFGTLIGSPPDLEMVSKMVKHCLFIHDPLFTYISHTKSSIYLLESPSNNSLNDVHGNSATVSWKVEEGEEVAKKEIEEECTYHIVDECNQPWGRKSLERKMDNHKISQVMEAEINKVSPIEGKFSLLLCKFLNVLANSLINTPDGSNSRCSDVFQPEVLLSLVNHPHPGVRCEAVNLINCWLQRSSTKGDKIYFLLSNQLLSFPVTEGIINKCLDIAHKIIGFNLQEYHSSSFFEEDEPLISPSVALIPTLALLPYTVNELSLAHGIINHIHRVLAKDIATLKKLVLNFELLRILLATLKAVTHTNNLCLDICGQDSREILTNDLNNLFGLVVYHFVTDTRNENFDAFDRFMHLYLEETILNPHPFLIRSFMTIAEEALVLLQTSIYGIDNSSVYNSRQKNNVLSPIIFSNKGDSINCGSSANENERTAYIKQNGKIANRVQMASRFSKLYKLAGQFILCSSDRSMQLLSAEKFFFKSLVMFSLNELSSISERPKIRSIIQKEDLKLMSTRLFSFGLSPLVNLDLRIHILKILSKPKDFHSLYKLGNNPIYLIKELIQNYSQLMSEDDRNFCYSFVKELDEIFSKFMFSDEIIDMILHSIRENKSLFIHSVKDKFMKEKSRLEKLTESLTEMAVKYTKSVMKAQTAESKTYIDAIRLNLIDKVKAQRGWKSIVEQLTHDMGPWVFESHRPKSWFLGEVEGEQRMRIRIEQRRLKISKKHYLPEHMHKGEEERLQYNPFQFLLVGPLGMSEIIIDKLSSDNHIIMMEQCHLILPDDKFEGEVLVGNNALYYVHEFFTMTWYYDEIKELHLRRYELKEIGVELFLNQGVTRFLIFNSKESRVEFVNTVLEKNPHLSETSDPCVIMKRWQEGLITNFEYLMELNKLAGRSFNDLMQYPIYPFVLSDYKSEVLDLTDSKFFRNLRKPVSIQNPDKESKYQETYETIERECNQRKNDVQFPGVDLGPYHYGSHYSNSGIVLYFLQRLPPFTNFFLKFQDGNFDLPDRTFHSMADTWRLASEDSITDVKELLPDLFCLPDLFMNKEGLNFGVRQNGVVVNDVEVPLWSHKNPRMFIKIHRQALESNYVRENLCHWIDLVFGYKQSGQAAIDAINVFHPSTYYGFNVDSIQDSVQRSARIAMIQTYGQTPKQLFGLRWGNYIGSPDEKNPAIIWSSSIKKLAFTLVPMSNNRIYGLPSNASLIFTKRCSNGDYGVIYWNNSNHRLYLQMKGLKKNTYFPEHVTSIGTCSKDMSIWIGTQSGNISVFPYDETLSLKHLGVLKLYAQSSAITNLEICSEFGLVISASKDGVLIFWDIKKRSFIRSLTISESDIKFLRMSKTCGDLAIISQIDKFSSKLILTTINGHRVESKILEPQVTALCISSVSEGVSVNTIATGHASGLIRLWSSWDLSPMRDISTSQYYPILSLAFSLDNQHLYASTQNKEIIVFEKSESKGFSQPPKYLYCDDSGDSILVDCYEPGS